MGNDLIEEIAKDLGIKRFRTENEKSYCSRVIYSGIACWIKASTMDSNQSAEESVGVSKIHVLHKTEPILNEILARIPCVVPYFTEEGCSVIGDMRDRMLRTGELEYVGFKTNIILRKRESFQLGSGIYREVGTILDENSVAVGLSQIHLGEIETVIVDEKETGEIWLRHYLQTASWKKISKLDDKYEYFDANMKTGSNYACWVHSFPGGVNNSVVLLRSGDSRTGYTYYLLNRENGLHIHAIDSFYASLGEVKRIMFLLRKQANNAVKVYVREYADNVQIKLGATLPDREENLLYSYAWPIEKYTNKINWIMLPKIWIYIKSFFEILGLEIMEEIYNG